MNRGNYAFEMAPWVKRQKDKRFQKLNRRVSRGRDLSVASELRSEGYSSLEKLKGI